MTAGVRALGVVRGSVRGIVVAAVAVAVLAGCGSSTAVAPVITPTAEPVVPASTTPAAAPTTTARATPTGAASTSAAEPKSRTTKVPPGGLLAFATPGRSVSCIIVAAGGDAAEYVRCHAAQKSWKAPAKPAGCKLAYEDLQLSVDGASFVCAGDSIVSPKAKVLAVADTVVAGKLTCTVTGGGVSCTDGRTKRGFQVSRAAYELV